MNRALFHAATVAATALVLVTGAAGRQTTEVPTGDSGSTASAQPARPARSAASAQSGGTYTPVVKGASKEGRLAMAGFELADGIEIELWAAEPKLANPVCLYVDHAGDVYVAETFRLHAGVTDMRDHMDWLEDELALRTVEDRVEMMKRREGEGFAAGYTVEHERVRMLRDTDGDGIADLSTVFADGFNDAADGIGAGLLSYKGDVYYTCIPNLWKLADTDADGVADERSVLHTGYGVHIALLGHDMHGLRIGPDGFLYFSIGDRGFHVETEGEVFAHDHTGAVLRCELDGSGLEVIHTGLRNPQELAFDDWGNLFTGDNNSDGGDEARWVEILDGGDSGWRFHYQTLEQPVARGPWNSEKLWHPAHAGQPAWILPPIANFAHGPSGLASYPGTGLTNDYKGHFFLVDFRGAAGYSGVYDFALEPQGASWKMGPAREFLWNALPTDIDFGPDGNIYVSDWVHGWGQTGKGRVYRLFNPGVRDSAIVRETAELLRAGMTERSIPELDGLLSHADRRVRQEAHFELASRSGPGHIALTRAALSAPDVRARVHATWGIGLAARRHGLAWSGWGSVLADSAPEVRATALRVVGDLGATAAGPSVRQRLGDPDPRVRLRAALALGRLETRDASGALLKFLRAEGNDEPTLRHAASWALSRCASEEELVGAVEHPDVRVRMGALLALRHKRSPEVARFLNDADRLIVLEAARAIHDDLMIQPALPALANSIGREDMAEDASFMRRGLSAANHLGGDQRARSLARFAQRSEADDEFRAQAVLYLAHWGAPNPREAVTGIWRPLPARDASFLPALAAELATGDSDLTLAPERVSRAWIEFVRTTEARALEPRLALLVLDADRPSSVRSDALEALEAFEYPGLPSLLDSAFTDRDGELRAVALEVLERLDPSAALPRIPAILEQGEIAERRAAYRILSREGSPSAASLLEDELRELAADGISPELALDLIAAAEALEAPELEALLRGQTRFRREDWLPGPYVDSLFGGDLERGRKLFNEDAALDCQRCHATESDATSRVGPDLSGLGRRRTRLEIVESIVDPNLRVTAGYESTVLHLFEGSAVAGRILEETDEYILVQTSAGELVEVEPANVDERRPDLSAMPDGLHEQIDRHKMRDLLEFLSSL